MLNVCICHEKDVLLKVIIETALLRREEKIKACKLVRQANADFVKTPTGFGPGGAEDAVKMIQAGAKELEQVPGLKL